MLCCSDRWVRGKRRSRLFRGHFAARRRGISMGSLHRVYLFVALASLVWSGCAETVLLPSQTTGNMPRMGSRGGQRGAGGAPGMGGTPSMGGAAGA